MINGKLLPEIRQNHRVHGGDTLHYTNDAIYKRLVISYIQTKHRVNKCVLEEGLEHNHVTVNTTIGPLQQAIHAVQNCRAGEQK